MAAVTMPPRPACVRPGLGLTEPVLIVSVAHLEELGFGDDLEVRKVLMYGPDVGRGVWLVPHPDEKL